MWCDFYTKPLKLTSKSIPRPLFDSFLIKTNSHARLSPTNPQQKIRGVDVGIHVRCKTTPLSKAHFCSGSVPPSDKMKEALPQHTRHRSSSGAVAIQLLLDDDAMDV